jgi:hypothetical protein
MAKKKFRAALKGAKTKRGKKHKAVLFAGLPMPDQFRPFGKKKKKGKGKGK